MRTNNVSSIEVQIADERGYRHLKLPKLKDMCKRNKLKVGGNKKALVERLEKWYHEKSYGDATSNIL